MSCIYIRLGPRLEAIMEKWAGAVVSGYHKGSPVFFHNMAGGAKQAFNGRQNESLGIQQKCVLCGKKDETRDHLFFACPYSYTVWDRLAIRLIGSGLNPDWNWYFEQLQGRMRNQVDRILLRLVFQTSVYHIWRERNARRHQKGPQ